MLACTRRALAVLLLLRCHALTPNKALGAAAKSSKTVVGSSTLEKPSVATEVQRPSSAVRESSTPVSEISRSQQGVISDGQDLGFNTNSVDEAGDGKASQNAIGYFLDAVTGVVFSALHAADETGVVDSSKNLRVLWARALLDHVGDISDPIAGELLPRLTRDVVKWEALRPLAKFAEFITSRTVFIDTALDAFLDAAVALRCANGCASGCAAQVVVLGAGFDTRGMRYAARARESDVRFFEVDLPHVVQGKAELWDRWAGAREERRDLPRPAQVAYDLNDDALELRRLLERAGCVLDRDSQVPTLFIVEAVLFYVDDAPTRALFEELLLSASTSENAALVVTDSLKPLLVSPFAFEARSFFDQHAACARSSSSSSSSSEQQDSSEEASSWSSKRGAFELLAHASRWGGAVHYAFGARAGSPLRERLSGAYDASAIKNLYLPMDAPGAAQRLAEPSFERAWYAVAFSEQIGVTASQDTDEGQDGGGDGAKPYATRLWGEPLVLFRDAHGEVVCLADACPHRAAPLSMGRVSDNGELSCFYHGWKFGTGGKRTAEKCATSGGDAKAYAVAERDGLVFVWRGHLLEADLQLLPALSRGATPTHAVDTVLDYKVGFEYIVENNLDSVHLFHLHDGSIPPISGLGMTRENLERLETRLFKDDVGFGSVGRLAGAARPNKLVRFDAPNVVRHGGVSGFHEEFHIVPIAPHRTRVLLRQHLPKGPILTTLLGVPGVPELLVTLVRNWNYQIGLEDYAVMQGQSHSIDDLGAPRLNKAGQGDELVARFYAWRDKAIQNDGGEPYFTKWRKQTGARPEETDKGAWSYERTPPRSEEDTTRALAAGAPMQGRRPRIDYGVRQDDATAGTVGIRETFHQVHPIASFPPADPRPYLPLYKAHVAANRLFGIDVEKHSQAPSRKTAD